jgi:hypothetical protein
MFVKFGSITMNEREARFSQPKRELFGLKRALEASEYLLIGCRKLIIEMDAKYIDGMLNHPEMGPNATINRWIEKILMFHFTLRHVSGKTFGPDGLSRREFQEGDQVYPPDEDHAEVKEPPVLIVTEGSEAPLKFEDFKDEIDTRGGYLLELARDEGDFSKDLEKAREGAQFEYEALKEHVANISALTKNGNTSVAQFTLDNLLPREANKEEIPVEYDEKHRTKEGMLQDERLEDIKRWLLRPLVRPTGMSDKGVRNLIRAAANFFVSKEGRVYRKGIDGAHKLVAEKHKRMGMMRQAHDSLGHRGFYATKTLIAERFWWPEMERDVSWYCKTCHICQTRQKLLVRVPPIVTHTPSIFQVLHADTMHMSPKSNGCGHVAHGRCGMTSWMEGRPLKNENGRTIGMWIFEDILCRWGCIVEIVTDNGGPYRAAIAWLEQKYGIKGIKISPYNSKANGKIERPHWDIRQMLYKATDGNPSKWFWFFYHVMWADRVTIRKGLGCSPFFMVTGAHPILPLDVQEATWLVELPDRKLSTAELIGFRARALAKHRQHVAEMRQKITQKKRDWLLRYERENRHTIKDLAFKRGDLVLVRNTEIESSLDKKMKARYNGPMIVVSRSRGGSYILAEMDGTVSQQKVGAFRVIPYFARSHIELPDDVYEWIDVSGEALQRVEDGPEDVENNYKDFNFDGVNLRDNDADSIGDEETQEE